MISDARIFIGCRTHYVSLIRLQLTLSFLHLESAHSHHHPKTVSTTAKTTEFSHKFLH